MQVERPRNQTMTGDGDLFHHRLAAIRQSLEKLDPAKEENTASEFQKILSELKKVQADIHSAEEQNKKLLQLLEDTLNIFSGKQGESRGTNASTSVVTKSSATTGRETNVRLDLSETANSVYLDNIKGRTVHERKPTEKYFSAQADGNQLNINLDKGIVQVAEPRYAKSYLRLGSIDACSSTGNQSEEIALENQLKDKKVLNAYSQGLQDASSVLEESSSTTCCEVLSGDGGTSANEHPLPDAFSTSGRTKTCGSHNEKDSRQELIRYYSESGDLKAADGNPWTIFCYTRFTEGTCGAYDLQTINQGCSRDTEAEQEKVELKKERAMLAGCSRREKLFVLITLIRTMFKWGNRLKPEKNDKSWNSRLVFLVINAAKMGEGCLAELLEKEGEGTSRLLICCGAICELIRAYPPESLLPSSFIRELLSSTMFCRDVDGWIQRDVLSEYQDDAETVEFWDMLICHAISLVEHGLATSVQIASVFTDILLPPTRLKELSLQKTHTTRVHLQVFLALLLASKISVAYHHKPEDSDADTSRLDLSLQNKCVSNAESSSSHKRVFPSFKSLVSPFKSWRKKDAGDLQYAIQSSTRK